MIKDEVYVIHVNCKMASLSKLSLLPHKSIMTLRIDNPNHANIKKYIEATTPLQNNHITQTY
jgi:hypothetical protein